MADKKRTEKSGSKSKARSKTSPKRKPASAPKRQRAARVPLLTDDRRRIIRIVLGVLCGLLTLYTLVALISYVFTWTSDQSLSYDSEMFSLGTAAENAGGKIGYLWANLLFSKLFGFGAFAIPVFLGFLTVYCFHIKKVNLLRVFLLCAFGAVIFSVLLAYIFSFTSFDSLLGSGAGGSASSTPLQTRMKWICSRTIPT